MNLKERRITMVRQQLKPLVPIVRSWFLDEGLKYMKTHKMTNLMEDVLESISEHYLASLDEIEGKVACSEK